MKSVIKRSVVIGKHKTSISLEDEFWNSIREIANDREQGMGQLLATIDAARTHANLSSAIRLFVLDYYRNRFATQQALEQTNLAFRAAPVQDTTLSNGHPSVGTTLDFPKPPGSSRFPSLASPQK